MKIALKCNSPLLQKSLEIFLKEYKADIKECDFVVSDYDMQVGKPIFLVSHSENANQKIPFTRDMLHSSLSVFYYNHRQKSDDEKELDDIVNELNKKHKAKIDKIIGEFYAKN